MRKENQLSGRRGCAAYATTWEREKAFALTGREGRAYDYPGRCHGLGAAALSGRTA